MQEEKYDVSLLTLPMVPLRGVVVFPYTVMNFEVARPFSILALEEAMQNNQRIFLVAQKNLRVETPAREDIYTIGAIANVRHLVRLPGGAIRVLVEGISRAELDDYAFDEYYSAHVHPIPEQEPASDQTLEAYMRTLLEYYKEFGSVSNRVSPETVVALAEVDSPSKLADTIAVNLVTKVEDKQKFLETLDVRTRIEALIDYIAQELKICKIEHEITMRTKLQLEKMQKEHFMREQIKVIQTALGEDNPDAEMIDAFHNRIEAAPLPDATKEKLQKEVQRLSRLSPQSPDHNVLRTYLEWVTSLPLGVYTQDEASMRRVSKVLNSEHYGMPKVNERILEHLAVRQLNQKAQGSILCLVGPPGVGKTSVARSIAKALNKEFVRISLGGLRDEAEIRGHRRTYIGAIPGRIASSIKQAGCMNPLFLLDEIDKMVSDFHGDPAAAMLEVLDPEINSTFQDHYLDMELDLSSVLFVTTANDADSIPRPLLDRMEVIELQGYTALEKEEIALRHLIPKQLEKHGLSKSILRIERPALRRIIDGYTGESGVRGLERCIAQICRKAAKEYLDGKQHIIVRQKSLEHFLGLPKFMDTQLPKQDSVGVCVGLAWTAAGGTTMPIEVCVMDGNGSFELTGQLGDVMKESAKTGLSLVRSWADELGICAEFHKEKDLHIHIPEGAVPKDGPSAGITMATAIVSALSGKKVRANVAMTGEITLTGRVLPIGGLTEKALAAARAGIKTVIFPAENVKNVQTLPDEIKKALTFLPVEDFHQVLDAALVSQ